MDPALCKIRYELLSAGTRFSGRHCWTNWHRAIPMRLVLKKTPKRGAGASVVEFGEDQVGRKKVRR